MNDIQCVIAMDLGGTKIKVAGVDDCGNILGSREEPSPSDSGAAMVEALERLASGAVEEYGARGCEVKAIGVGAAGYVLQREGVMVSAPNIAWRNEHLREIAARATGLPAFLDNDANGAAAGEHLYGVARGKSDFVLLTLGTGIGGGIYAGGRLLRGHRGMASEPGHVQLDPDGPPCGCGRNGCLEALASGTALARIAREVATGEGAALLPGGDGSEITGKTVAETARRKDPVALRAFEIWSDNLGMGVASLIHIFDPELVVLGGGVSESGELFIDLVREAVLRHGIRAIVEGVPIEISALGNDAGILGAAALAWEGLAGL